MLIDAAHAIERLEVLESIEGFHAVRRLDGELIHGEYAWFLASGPDDWSSVELEWEVDPEAAFEMVIMRPEPIATKAPPPKLSHDCRACWSADPSTLKLLMPPFACPECGRFNCPKADAHVNSCLG